MMLARDVCLMGGRQELFLGVALESLPRLFSLRWATMWEAVPWKAFGSDGDNANPEQHHVGAVDSNPRGKELWASVLPVCPLV